MELTTEQVFDLKYKVEHPFLKEWSKRHGIIDCVAKIRHCLQSGFGWMDTQRIDRNFVASLGQSDRTICNSVLAWLDK